jgi:hypothetical protein
MNGFTTRLAGALAIVMMMGLLGGVSAARAATAQADLSREMRDRADIEDLMWRYCRALDSLDADASAAVYTADGQFGTGERAEKGPESLKKMIAGVKKGRAEREAKGEKSAPMYHVILNHAITFRDADHATYNAYWMTVFGAVGQEKPVQVAAAGRSVDELVRVKGHWLIQKRDVAPKD